MDFMNDNFNYSQQAHVKRMMENYDEYLQTVSKFKTDFTDEQAAKLAVVLNNTDNALAHASRMYESTQPADIGLFKKHALALISAVMPNLIAEDLISVQPLQQKVGQIFYLKYLYGTTRNGINAGETMFDQFSAPKYNPNYTNEDITDEEFATGNGSITQFDGNLSFVPLRPGTIVVKAGSVTGQDDGNGKIVGAGITTGTVDYASGAVSIKFSAAVGDGTTVDVDYSYDLEYAPSTIPEVQLKVEEATVKARPRKLKALYSFDAGYDLKMSQGIDIDEALLQASVAEIKTEMDAEFMLDLLRQAGGTSTWNKKWSPTTMNITKREHDLTFIDELVSAGNQMFQETKRVQPNFLVVGKWGADILDSIGAPRFVSAGPAGAIGPHFAGTLDGKYKVYKNPYFAEDEYLLGYKGSTLVDSGYIYCPYLPIYSTQLLMMEDFVGRKGFATSYGKKMVNNKYYIKGKITNN